MLPFWIIGLPLNIGARLARQELESLRSIIYKYAASDTPISIQSGTTFKMIIFAKIDYQKNAEGNMILPLIVPQSTQMKVTLNNSLDFEFQLQTQPTK